MPEGELLKAMVQQVPGMVGLIIIVMMFLKAMKAEKEQDRLTIEALREDIRENTKASQELALAVRLAGSCINFKRAG
jgi:hypothetical protein